MIKVTLSRGHALIVQRVRHPPRHALASELDPALHELRAPRGLAIVGKKSGAAIDYLLGTVAAAGAPVFAHSLVLLREVQARYFSKLLEDRAHLYRWV